MLIIEMNFGIKIFLLVFLFGFLVLAAIGLFQKPNELEISTKRKAPSPTQALKENNFPQIRLSSEKLGQGDTLLVRIENSLELGELKGEFNSKEIKFFRLGKKWFSILGISVKEKPGKYQLVIDFPSGEKIEKEIEITKKDFRITKILINEELEKKGYTPSKIVEGIAIKENSILKEVFAISTERPYFQRAFVYPLDQIKDIGPFGDIRKSGDLTLQHLGVDLEAKLNSPVYAINDGVVRLAQGFENYGKTVVIDHGLGIFSLYLHLNKFKVSAGQEVKRGQIIALSGNTGYSLEPHLHLSIKIGGSSVDPLKFIALTQNEFPK